MNSLLSRRKSNELSELPPITAQPAYVEQQEKLERLKTELRRLSEEKARLVNSANEYQGSRAQVLADAYLSGASPSASPETVSLQRRADELSLKINALHMAVEVAERDLTALEVTLSHETKSLHAPAVRAAARRVLAGMLMIQAANDAITDLQELRVERGYRRVLNRIFPGPWPAWGNPEEETSQWRRFLRELSEAGHISAGERARIEGGVLTDFEP